jgi:serine/threonine protein kinase
MKDNIFTTKLYSVNFPDDENFDDIFLVMNFNHKDLKSMFREKYNNSFSFSEEHLKVVMYNLLCAIKFMHSANVIHRDLKPSNILIDSDCSIQICDFGLARSLKENSSD